MSDRRVSFSNPMAAALAAVLLLLAPASGDAQISRIRDVKAKIEQAREGEPEKPSPYDGERVLEITPAVAEKLEKAITAELTEMEAFESWASTVKTHEQYDLCRNQVMTGPNGMKLAEEMSAIMLEMEGEEQMKALEALQKKIDALTEESCGPNPLTVVARAQEAEKKALESAVEASGLTPAQIAIIKERFIPACGSNVLESADPEDGLEIPAGGTNVYVYSAVEVETLKATCATLMPKLQLTL